MQATTQQDFSQTLNTFKELRELLEEILRRYRIPPSQADVLLEASIVEWLYQAPSDQRAESLLISKARRKCRLYWVARRRAVAEAVSRTFQPETGEAGGRN